MIITGTILVLVLCHIRWSQPLSLDTGIFIKRNHWNYLLSKLEGISWCYDILPVNAIFVFDIDKLEILSLESEWKREMLGSLFIRDIFEIYLRWTLISWEYNGSNQTHGCYWRSRLAAAWSACIIIILSLSSPSQVPVANSQHNTGWLRVSFNWRN